MSSHKIISLLTIAMSIHLIYIVLPMIVWWFSPNVYIISFRKKLNRIQNLLKLWRIKDWWCSWNILWNHQNVISEFIYLPVSIWSLFLFIQSGTANPSNKDVPRINRFLEELRSMNCRLDSPTAVTIPTQKQAIY